LSRFRFIAGILTFLCLASPIATAPSATAKPSNASIVVGMLQSPRSPGRAARFMSTRSAHPSVAATVGSSLLSYHGGISGTAIQYTPKVYVVFYGRQWGTATTIGADLTFSGDPAHMAPRVQQFLRGMYGTENWSTSTTQYCDGTSIAVGRTQCGGSGRHTKHATSSPLAGVWYDNASNAVAAPSESSIRASAVRAAKHFGNVTAASNASAQYVIVVPTHIVPPGFGSQYCAYHSSGTSAVGTIAYTNLPYIPDAGFGCGANLVNAGTAGALDGVTIVEGHEYAETLSDLLPPKGWLDSSGAENGDKCAWITSGPGKSANVTFPTGRFAVQSLWSNNAHNNAGGCVIYYNSATSQG